jgi:hypothetical protein
MVPLATIDDLTNLWRSLTVDEQARASELLGVVSDILREEAIKVGKDLDRMISERPSFSTVVKSVVVDIVGRALMTQTSGEPMIQSSESAMGYSWSGTFLVPGGGLFIKNTELTRLGLKRQRYGVMELYE